MKPACILRLLTLAILVVACLIVVVSTWLAVDFSRRAEDAFGAPAEGLSRIQALNYSFRLLQQKSDLNTPVKPQGITQPFSIRQGESITSITTRLQEQGLIHNAQALRDYLVYSGLDTTLQSGQFELNPGMNAVQIAWALQDSTPAEITFRILAGWRLEEIGGALPTSGLEFSTRAFLAAAYEPDPALPVVPGLPEGASLEGFLFPDSYRLPRQTSLEAFLKIILSDFEVKVGPQLRDNFEKQGLSLYQAVTLASIIQREAVVDEEMPMIASVFLNRLVAGMRLDTDPTIQYALGFDHKSRTWWKSPLSLDDLQVNSPYNTYRAFGLPPGPISNPGMSALNAVAFPAETPYYYFRSACDGSGRHAFAETFEEHQANACP